MSCGDTRKSWDRKDREGRRAAALALGGVEVVRVREIAQLDLALHGGFFHLLVLLRESELSRHRLRSFLLPRGLSRSQEGTVLTLDHGEKGLAHGESRDNMGVDRRRKRHTAVGVHAKVLEHVDRLSHGRRRGAGTENHTMVVRNRTHER